MNMQADPYTIMKHRQDSVLRGAVEEITEAQYTRLTLQRMADILAQFKAEQQPRPTNRRRNDEYIPLLLGDTV
jgi:hypothetical protein